MRNLLILGHLLVFNQKISSMKNDDKTLDSMYNSVCNLYRSFSSPAADKKGIEQRSDCQIEKVKIENKTYLIVPEENSIEE
jgi:hypothetical protein